MMSSQTSRFSSMMGDSGNPALKLLGSVLILGTLAALIAFAFLYNKKKPCKDFTCPDGKTNRVNSKGTSIEECCYTATPTGTPVGDEEPEEPADPTTEGGGKKKNVGMIVGAAIGGVLLLLIIGFMVFAVIGRRSLKDTELAALRATADDRATKVLGSSRLSAAIPIASRSYLGASYAREGVSQVASRAAGLYRKASSIASLASKKRDPEEAAQTLEKSAEVGAAATETADLGASSAQSGLGSSLPGRSGARSAAMIPTYSPRSRGSGLGGMWP